MPYPFETPVLSGKEIVAIRKVLENRLTDTCFLTTFDASNYVYRMFGRFGVSLWDGDTARDDTVEGTASYYRVLAASWGAAQACRVTSTGTGSKLVNNNTQFTTNITVELPRGVAITPVSETVLAPSSDAAFIYDQYLIVGTFIAYNNEVYRVIGINKPDSVPTIQRVTAELDDSNDSGVTVFVAGATNITGYATAGRAIRAVSSVPSIGKYIITDTGVRIGTESGDNFVTKE